MNGSHPHGFDSNGILTISLDFELYWGVRDKLTLEQYGENLRGVREAVRRMLSTFAAYDVHVTWAIVGFLFFESAEALERASPAILPEYRDPSLSPYRYIRASRSLERVCHFAPDVIDTIRCCPGQEIATHTFSHYYCLAEGQDIAAFRADLAAAVKAARDRGIQLRSIVFPRNQANAAYLEVLEEFGLVCYRGNENNRYYSDATFGARSPVQRAVRLIDSYVNLTGPHTYAFDGSLGRRPYNIPASRFLRPYAAALTLFEPMRLRRITSALEDAATSKRLFHLWWHPHNFGTFTDQNIAFLRQILDRFAVLKERLGMESLNMAELAARLDAICATRT